MSLTLHHRPALTVIGLRLRTVPMSPEIPALWPRFVARMGEISGQTEPGVTYGVMRSDGDALEYLAAVAVAPGSPVPEGMACVEVPAGDFARFASRWPSWVRAMARFSASCCRAHRMPSVTAGCWSAMTNASAQTMRSRWWASRYR